MLKHVHVICKEIDSIGKVQSSIRRLSVNSNWYGISPVDLRLDHDANKNRIN